MRRLNGLTVLLLVLAALWGVLQLLLAFFVHVAVRGYDRPSGWVVPPTKTYMQAFGVSEIALTAVTMALVVFVGLALHRRAGRGLLGAGRVAWVVSVATTVLGALGFVYLLGVGLCLLLACASVPRPTRARRVRGSGVPTATGAG
jgi:hypothetical protein